MSDIQLTAEQLQEQVKSFETVAARTIDPCTVATFIAISDEKVQQTILKKVADGNVFHGVACLAPTGIPELRRVLFRFECKPGIFCLIPPSFLVIVNFIDGRVVGITDPYIPTVEISVSEPQSTCGMSHFQSHNPPCDNPGYGRCTLPGNHWITGSPQYAHKCSSCGKSYS
jgi:hypothetical protein